jgi:hypothetical protein
MLVDLDKIKYYFLTCNNEIRQKHMIEEFKEYDLTEVNPVIDCKNKSGAVGFSRILDLACLNQERDKPFQPFVILEDDVKKYREFPKTIEIPNDTDILYIGISLFGMNDKTYCETVCCKNINEYIIQVYNMLAFHGTIICSARGALAIQKCMLEGYFKNIIWDIFTAQIQPFYNVYALKTPLVYQYAEIGGIEWPTKIEFKNKKDENIDSSWINKNNISSITCFETTLPKTNNINYLNNIFKNYGPIEKKIHISWKNKDILNTDFSIIKNGIKALKNLNPEYEFEISDDNDVDNYIKTHISKEDYDLIKDKHIVEKSDVWRLLKIYHEGGIYMDIDRLCNIPLSEIIKPNIKCILPMHYDIDFSQDIMVSCSNNILHKKAIELNLERRRNGWNDVLSLAPINYFHAITKVLLGEQINRYPNTENLNKLRNIINHCIYLDTYREDSRYNTLMYRGDPVVFDKIELYKYCNTTHWVSECGNDPLNKPGGP